MKKGSNNRGKTYNPDYIIKAEYGDRNDYIILDAKFSTPENIRLNQLQGLVYKYLFSISTLDEKDRLLGLYILCGKRLGKDGKDIIHDLAKKIGRSVIPFAEILVVNGVNMNDYSMIEGFSDLSHRGEYNTILGMYGFTSDKDFNDKTRMLENVRNSMDNYYEERLTDGDKFFYIVRTGVKTKVKSR